jgi:hypothetical protein
MLKIIMYKINQQNIFRFLNFQYSEEAMKQSFESDLYDLMIKNKISRFKLFQIYNSLTGEILIKRFLSYVAGIISLIRLK